MNAKNEKTKKAKPEKPEVDPAFRAVNHLGVLDGQAWRQTKVQEKKPK
jgi:hypothetical protein